VQRAEVELQLGEAYLAAIGQSIGAGRCDPSRGTDQVGAAAVFDPDAFNGFNDKLEVLRKSLARTQAQAARRSDAANVKSELATLTRTDCQRADAARGPVDRRAALRARFPNHAASIDSAVTEWLAQCVVRTGEVDQDKAMSLRQQALVAFGPVPRHREAEAPIRARCVIWLAKAPRSAAVDSAPTNSTAG
jgi:hypothetical protein